MEMKIKIGVHGRPLRVPATPGVFTQPILINFVSLKYTYTRTNQYRPDFYKPLQRSTLFDYLSKKYLFNTVQTRNVRRGENSNEFETLEEDLVNGLVFHFGGETIPRVKTHFGRKYRLEDTLVFSSQESKISSKLFSIA